MNVKYFNMIDQFSRLRLLIGKEQLEIIQSKRILVFGLGGVGGNVCDALVRSGIQNITIVDNDKVTITNINRQLIANMNTIGKYKTDVMEDHLLSINTKVNVIKKNIFFLPDNKEEIEQKQGGHGGGDAVDPKGRDDRHEEDPQQIDHHDAGVGEI